MRLRSLSYLPVKTDSPPEYVSMGSMLKLWPSRAATVSSRIIRARPQGVSGCAGVGDDDAPYCVLHALARNGVCVHLESGSWHRATIACIREIDFGRERRLCMFFAKLSGCSEFTNPFDLRFSIALSSGNPFEAMKSIHKRRSVRSTVGMRTNVDLCLRH